MKRFCSMALLGFTVCGVIFSGTILAQSKPSTNESSPLSFASVDKNHDGMLTRSEIPKQLNQLRAHFDQYDIDQNHQLSQAEYSIYLKGLAAAPANKMFRPVTPTSSPQTAN